MSPVQQFVIKEIHNDDQLFAPKIKSDHLTFKTLQTKKNEKCPFRDWQYLEMPKILIQERVVFLVTCFLHFVLYIKEFNYKDNKGHFPFDRTDRPNQAFGKANSTIPSKLTYLEDDIYPSRRM